MRHDRLNPQPISVKADDEDSTKRLMILNFRAQTIQRFREWGLEPNLNLPLIESPDGLRPKTAQEVARRAVAASNIAALCFGAPLKKVETELNRIGLWSTLTNREQALFSIGGLNDASKSYNSWLAESIQFMAWALGLSDLDHLAACPDDLAARMPKPGTDHSGFMESVTLRPLQELLQASDMLYMLHWRAVESNLKGSPDKRILLPRISFRRHAADWVVGVADDWDDVPLDT